MKPRGKTAGGIIKRNGGGGDRAAEERGAVRICTSHGPKDGTTIRDGPRGRSAVTSTLTRTGTPGK